MDLESIFEAAFADHLKLVEKCKQELKAPLLKASLAISEALKNRNKILIAGNGGSAADAQHIAAEFCGRFLKERKGLAAMALTTDTSALTAIGNDYGFGSIFSRQVEALANPGDIFWGISTSGNSPNVLSALVTARRNQCITIGFSGRDGGKMKDICDINIIVPSDVTARIQEIHILVGHIICGQIDELF